MISGDHKLDGVLLCRNPRRNDKKLSRSRASLMDIAPTALYALGLPVPDDMDGQVLEELFDEDFRRANPVRFSRSDDSPSSHEDGEKKDYDDAEDEEKVKERLRSLGYLE